MSSTNPTSPTNQTNQTVYADGTTTTDRGLGRATLDVFRYEAERRVRITAVIAVALVSFGALFVWIGPQVTAGVNVEELEAAFPPAMKELLGLESLASLEGLLAGEFYTLGWIVGLGAYVAYTAAGSVAGDVEADRMDMLLAAPVSRTSVLLGKYLALLVPIVTLNLVVPGALYAGSVLVGEPLPLGDVAALHTLAVPYLLCWGALGLSVGVVVRRGRTAGRLALGLVLAAWLVESLTVGTDVEWVGALSPTRYFDPVDILLRSTYDLSAASLLVGVAAVSLLVSRALFARADL